MRTAGEESLVRADRSLAPEDLPMLILADPKEQLPASLIWGMSWEIPTPT